MPVSTPGYDSKGATESLAIRVTMGRWLTADAATALEIVRHCPSI
jgi:hypothetical protein